MGASVVSVSRSVNEIVRQVLEMGRGRCRGWGGMVLTGERLCGGYVTDAYLLCLLLLQLLIKHLDFAPHLFDL